MAKPTVLYIGQPILFAHEAWARFQEYSTILFYDLTSREDAIVAFAPLNTELVPHLPSSCRIISSSNHGYDGEDTLALEQRGIWYCNGAGGATDATADSALFLVLAVFRYTKYCEHVQREGGSASFFAIEDVANQSHDTNGHVLGIVGMEGIGEATAVRARALGMSIHYYNRRRKPDVEASLGGEVVYHDTLTSLLGVSDCVPLACPHTPETHYLLNRETFKVMKRGSRVVNIARGKCIDEEALADALEEGIISSAGLDVFHDEPMVNPRLLSNWKATLLPHIGGGTLDSSKKFEEIAFKNIEAFFLGDGSR